MTPSSEEQTLKPCPFCGGPALEPRMWDGTLETGCAGDYECPGTDVLVPLAAWNHRSSGEPPIGSSEAEGNPATDEKPLPPGAGDLLIEKLIYGCVVFQYDGDDYPRHRVDEAATDAVMAEAADFIQQSEAARLAAEEDARVSKGALFLVKIEMRKIQTARTRAEGERDERSDFLDAERDRFDRILNGMEQSIEALTADRDAALTALDANWVQHQRVVAAEARATLAEGLIEQARKGLGDLDQWHADRWEGCLEEARQAMAEGDQTAEREWMNRSNGHATQINAISSLLSSLSVGGE